MQDPMQGVPGPLLPHVHLISSYRYPLFPSIGPDTAVDHLLSAPKIVKDVAPVAWTYLQPPQDGTLLLTWQNPARKQKFASDGYIWLDPEASYPPMDTARGYKLEVLVQRSGYRPGEPVSAHARRRFRIVSCNNPAGAGTFDPSLWLVHYSTAEPQSRIETSRMPPSPEMQAMLQERRYLESQGQLVRKEFMLNDRQNWPHIQLAQGAYGPYGNPATHQMGRNQYQNQGNIGPSPAKRARQAPPPQMHGPAAGMAGLAYDPTLEEEDTSLGDLMDHLTPREISTARYMQHHEWLEEAFSSPYAMSQITPVNLGLGLAGDLAALTDGLFDTPNSLTRQGQRPGFASSENRGLTAAQLAEFRSRVSKFKEANASEMEQLKTAHAKTVSDLKHSKTFMDAERQLRDLIVVPQENADGQPEEALLDIDGEYAQQMAVIAEEVEKSLNLTFTQLPDVKCVDKGGLIEEDLEAKHREQMAQIEMEAAEQERDSVSNDPEDLEGGDAANMLDEFAASPGLDLDPPESQPTSQPNTEATAGAPAVTKPAVMDASIPGPLPDTMDVDEKAGLIDSKEASDWVMVESSEELKTATLSAPEQQAQPATTAAPAVNAEAIGVADATAPAPDHSAVPFEASDFDGLESLDTAGEDLADFGDEDLGLSLNNSAFDDAFTGDAPPDQDPA